MLLGPKKRTRVSDEESDSGMESGEIYGEVVINVKNKTEERTENIMQNDLKRMRLDLDHDTSRVIPSEFTNSSSESSPRTPSSYSTLADTTEYTSPSYQYHQFHRKQQSLDDTYLLNQNVHKLHRNPIRISTRSNASSSSSSAELLNPYMNINSVLYLANLTRTSHIVNELQDDLGCMEIDERERLVGNGTSSSIDDDSMNLGLDHDRHHQFQNDGYVNSSSEKSEYQSINAVLREAFLGRRPNLSC
ncbi:uncharacterized protein OCT59_028483 [Rhizophagus irregularis]|uniref:Uncharacterized protein n=2 Tax=Rhizophagus irregularis TaxID=588596 RepID=A0A916E0Z0_9GLOM|nr:hypothetical protein OCT59_028483 [Rhizophagus irregularis]CAB5207858.1 unnamed protein product [Rhizophagus irregularis]CAB5342530.1 unnamed protein product [Rhizophagus irregularis]CAG8553487.1 17709_t:CDS:2 [Rhizophagus irregularis]